MNKHNVLNNLRQLLKYAEEKEEIADKEWNECKDRRKDDFYIAYCESQAYVNGILDCINEVEGETKHES